MKKQQGSVTVFMLVLIVAMIGFAGYTYDVIKVQNTHIRLAQAADAALTSAGASENVEFDAGLIVNANLNSGVTAQFADQYLITVDNTEDKQTLDVSLTYEPDLMNQFIQDPLNIRAQATNDLTRSTAEIVFMLDVSGSMAGAPLDKTKKALLGFADKLYASGGENREFTISFVPASGNTNVGWYPEFFAGNIRRYDHAQVKLENSWHDMFDLAQGEFPAVPGRARGAMCRDLAYEPQSAGALGLFYFRNLEKAPLNAPRNTRRIIRPTVPPIQNVFDDGTPLDPPVYPSTNPADGYREHFADKAIFDEIECHKNAISPFMTTKTEFVRRTNELIAGMNTNNAEGMVWAARLLSPYWRGLWDSNHPKLPRNYGQPMNDKYLIVFSDGEHLIRPGYRDKKMRLICTQLKRGGRDVNIITVNFGGQASERLMKRCASKPEFYHLADLFNVDRVFDQIADQVIDRVLVSN
ncbi:VWA domain-containing protein [Thaumasiovibrio subtropicus]|uniref:VWA domain-containing protein n=1 Tax=Thaumasiovibrio subtropicus TaxID=1891207 RepID=UPI000B3545D7|nr:VWA domain-containing protein [Thaumasiovibrio subtropicus]